MGGQVTDTSRYPNFDINSATESHDGLFRFSAIPQLSYVPDNFLSADSLSSAAVIPPEHPNIWTAFALQLEEAASLKPAHTISFCVPLASSG
jgi:hypothetical protein